MSTEEQDLILIRLARRKKELDARIVALKHRLQELGKAVETLGKRFQGKPVGPPQPDDRQVTIEAVTSALQYQEELREAERERDDAIRKLTEAGIF